MVDKSPVKTPTVPESRTIRSSSSPTIAPLMKGSADTAVNRSVLGASVDTHTTGIRLCAALRIHTFN